MRKTLGRMSDMVSDTDYEFNKKDNSSLFDRIDFLYQENQALKKRVNQLEILVNDIMIQLDNPIKDQQLDGKRRQKKKSRQPSKPPIGKPSDSSPWGQTKGKDSFSKNPQKKLSAAEPQVDKTQKYFRKSPQNIKLLEANPSLIDYVLPVVEYFEKNKEGTKQEIVDSLDISRKMVGKVLALLQGKTIKMVSPPKTEDNPDPKKIFRYIFKNEASNVGPKENCKSPKEKK